MSDVMMGLIKRYIKKIAYFGKQGGFSISIDHFLAMLPATIMMPIVINEYIYKQAGMDAIFDVSFVLLVTGVGTLIFIALTKGKFPGYLGSSFAYISITEYICLSLRDSPQEEILSYIFGTYLFSAGLLMILSLALKIKGDEAKNFIDWLIPAEVMGPAISLIGLELSDQSFEMAGVVTNAADGSVSLVFPDIMFAGIIVFFFVLFSILKRKHFKNASVFLSFVVAAVVYVGVEELNKGGYQRFQNWNLQPLFEDIHFRLPSISLVVPKFRLSYCITIIPTTCILFCEHIARKIMTENLKLTKECEPKVKENITLSQSVLGNAAATLISSIFHGTPLTVYAENIAVMRINEYKMDSMQFIITALLSILVGFLNVQKIPNCLAGGLSIALMGIIAVPGIDLLIHKKVNYNKTSSLLMTAAVLIAGLSQLKINFFNTEFKGMSLGLLVGIILNLLIKAFTAFGWNKEPFVVEDVCHIAEEQTNVEKTIKPSHDGRKTIEYRKNEGGNNRLFLTIDSFDTNNVIKINVDENLDDDKIKEYISKCESFPKDGSLEFKLESINNEKTLRELIEDSYKLTK